MRAAGMHAVANVLNAHVALTSSALRSIGSDSGSSGGDVGGQERHVALQLLFNRIADEAGGGDSMVVLMRFAVQLFLFDSIFPVPIFECIFAFALLDCSLVVHQVPQDAV